MDGEKVGGEKGGEEKKRRGKEGERRQTHFAEPAGLQCMVKLNKKAGEKRKERRRRRA